MKSYDNEKKLVESLLNNKNNISNAQLYIKENYSVDSIYDKDISTLYVWGDDPMKTLAAKAYVKENINDELIDIELSKPDYDVVIEAEEDEVYVLYFDDGTMFNFYPDKGEAEKEKERLEKESKDNKLTIKTEPLSNFVK
jgi:hypothetical protein